MRYILKVYRLTPLWRKGIKAALLTLLLATYSVRMSNVLPVRKGLGKCRWDVGGAEGQGHWSAVTLQRLICKWHQLGLSLFLWCSWEGHNQQTWLWECVGVRLCVCVRCAFACDALEETSTTVHGIHQQTSNAAVRTITVTASPFTLKELNCSTLMNFFEDIPSASPHPLPSPKQTL